MKYFTFQPQFHAAVLACAKISTIRPKQKVKPGERFALRHWTGAPYRSKMGWLGTAVCTRVRSILIYRNITSHSPFPRMCVDVDEKQLNPLGLLQLADQEGFVGRYEMERWFVDNHKIDVTPLDAVITEWDPSTFIAGEAQS